MQERHGLPIIWVANVSSISSTAQSVSGTQALSRGLAVIQAVARGSRKLSVIGEAIGCTRSTTQRLVSALVHAGYLRHVPVTGLVLGPRLIELGFIARDQLPLAAVAHPHLEALALATQDTVHLGIAEGDDVLYLDKIAGQRGLEMASRIGHRMPLALTGLGKALSLDRSETEWVRLHQNGLAGLATRTRPLNVLSTTDYLAAMRDYAAAGIAFDLEENEIGIRCVAAPIRDASRHIVGAVSVSSATPFMPEDRMQSLGPHVAKTARDISQELGWSGELGS